MTEPEKKRSSSISQTLGQDNLNSMNAVASDGIRHLLGAAVVLFGLIGAWLPFGLAIIYQWNWVAIPNAILMTAGAVMGARGWLKKSTRLIWIGAGILISSLVIVQVIKEIQG